MAEIGFYAVRDDLRPVLRAVEARFTLQYARTGHYPCGSEVTCYVVSDDLPDLGIADSDSSIACTSYLVGRREELFVKHSILRNDGTQVFAIDQLMNPDTVTLTAGGWRGDAIISGRIANGLSSPVNREYMSAYRKEVRKRFSRIGSYFVGAGAAAFLDSSGRLTPALQSPARYDLSRT